MAWAEPDPRVEFLLKFARSAHRAGYPTADLEERVLALARTLDVRGAQVSATPTLIELSVGPLRQQQSYSLRVSPDDVDLDAIERLERLARGVLANELDAASALEALQDVDSRPLTRAWPVLVAAYSLAGAALTPILGGGWRDALAGAVVGLLVGVIAVSSRRTYGSMLVAPLAAVTAGFCASAIGALGLHVSRDIVALAALVTFLPGMTLTIGMRELATQHLQSGVANTANALFQLLGLVFGVGIGRSVADNWFGPSPEIIPDNGFHGTLLLAAVAAGLAFTVTLRAPYRSAPLMCGAATLALLANAAGSVAFGADAGVFIAALVVGAAGELIGAATHRSPLVFIVPGVLMLVPGSAGFNSLLQLLSGQTVSGIAAGFDTLVTAISIAYGLMVSTLVLPRRFTRVQDRDR